jgi:hypothetical protein
MAFVDGENLTIRAQNIQSEKGFTGFESGPYWLRDVFMWFPQVVLQSFQPSSALRAPEGPPALVSWNAVQKEPVRAYYYTSVFGDSDLLESGDPYGRSASTRRCSRKAGEKRRQRASISP